jgi:hypothetical protein
VLGRFDLPGRQEGRGQITLTGQMLPAEGGPMLGCVRVYQVLGASQ